MFDVGSFAENPFTVLTIVVAPAILTNAASILSMGVATHLGRVLDRRRIVSTQLAAPTLSIEDRLLYQRQLIGLDVRARIVLRALRFFYLSAGSFGGAALISLVGSIYTASVSSLHVGFTVIGMLGLLSGTAGVGGLVAGCAMMVQETRFAVHGLTLEAQPTNQSEMAPRRESGNTPLASIHG
jgi:uncharacterized protein DUF2721